MRKHKGSEPSCPASPSYLLPEDAHFALLQTRDQLRLLAVLADPRGGDESELRLPPGALAECFWRLAGDLDEVAGAAVWPGRPRKAEGAEDGGAAQSPGDGDD